MFKKILVPEVKPIVESGYFLGEFTFGFELEAWYSENHYRAKVSENFKKYWRQFNDINLDTMFFSDDGSIKPDDFEPNVECYECAGTGRRECYDCHGEGRKDCEYCNGSGRLNQHCEDCNGDGYIENDEGENVECETCNGDGFVEEECYECDGVGRVRCDECDERGENTCEYCGGDGYDIVEPDNTYEFKSPVMKLTPLNISRTIQFLKESVENDMINTNETCGFHIHMGFPDQQNRTKDIFWALCNLYLDEKNMDKILYFHDKELFSDEYAPLSLMKRLRNGLYDFSDEATNIFDMIKVSKAEGKKEKDDMGAYDLDVEKEMYEAYKEEFYIEAKLNKEDEKYFNVIKKAFVHNVLPYYSDNKYTIFRQHFQGTLEWRGARAFMDDKRISDIKDFLLNKFYFLAKELNKYLDKDVLNIKGVKIKRNIFNEFLKLSFHSGEIRVESKYRKNQDRSILGTVYRKFPLLNQIYFNLCTFKMPDKNTIEIEGGAYIATLDFKFKPLPKDVKINFIDIDPIKNITLDSPNIMARKSAFSFCKIYEGKYTQCKVENNNEVGSSEFEYPPNIIYGGYFNDSIIRSSTIFGGTFHNCVINKGKVFGGDFKECQLKNNVEIKKGNFIDCVDNFNNPIEI